MKRLLTLLFLCASTLLYAQPPVFSGPEFRMNKRDRFIGFLNIDSARLYGIIRSDPFFGGPVSISVQRFDRKTLEPTARFGITPDASPKSSRIYLHLLQIGERIVLVTLETDKLKGEKVVMAFSYGENGEKYEAVALDTIGPLVDAREDVSISMPDHSSNFVLSVNERGNEKQPGELRVKRFDGKLQCTATKVITFRSGADFELVDLYYNGETSFTFVAEKRSLLAQVDFAGEKPVPALWVHDFDRNLTREIEIHLPERRFESAKIGWNAGKWFVAGFYSTEADPQPEAHQATGIFTVILDPDMHIRAHNLVAFSDFPLPGKYDPIPRQIREPDLKTFAFFADGSFAVVAESQFVEKQNNAELRGAAGTLTETFYYETILVCHYNPDCKPLAAIAVPKEQVSMNDDGEYSSFAFQSTADKTMDLLFWDHPKNESVPLFSQEGRKNTNPFLYNDLVRIRISTDSKGIFHAHREPILQKKQKLRAKPVLAADFNGCIYLLAEHRQQARIIRVGPR